ncbi:MAG: hypothetical protein EB060_08375, partial [Proteobacteria bacterium]|nr:hypothetical protein [Pseudomonadota bacterium]
MPKQTAERETESKSFIEVYFSTKAVIVVLLVAAAILLGAVITWGVAGSERDRALQSWQARMGIVIEGQLSAIDSWLDRQYGALSALADNASLQLYMTTLADGTNGKSDKSDGAEATFLRNLLTVTADKNGFLKPRASSEINANVNPLGYSGMALLDNDGKTLVATRGMPPMEGPLKDFVKNTPRGQRAMLDIYTAASGEAVMAFLVPVFAIQGDNDPGSQVGVVVGVREVSDLFSLLKPPANSPETSESLLVRRSQNVVEYVSPQLDGTEPMKRQMDANTPNLEAVFAIDKIGAFGIKSDYRGKQVLVTGRPVAGTPWVLLHKVDADLALAESGSRRTRIILFFALASLVVVMLIVAAWKHGTSQKYAEQAERYRTLSEEFKSEEQLLRLVTDNQPDAMYILDNEDRYCFSNQEAAVRAGVNVKDMSGKTLESVLGPAKANVYKIQNEIALKKFDAVAAVHQFDGKYMQSRHIPIKSVPSVISHKDTPGVLIVEQDVSDVVKEREKRERTLQQIVDALVTAVDRRDPYAKNHSAKVARLARGVAEEMHLDATTADTTETAGKLMNIGKLGVSSELLTKKGKLSNDERKSIH